MSGQLTAAQIKWLQDELGIPPDVFSPKGMSLPLEQAGKLIGQTQPGGVFAKANATAAPEPDVDTIFDEANLQANNKGARFSSISTRARTDADLQPPDIQDADVDTAFDKNMSTGDLHQIAGQDPAQAVAEGKLADAMSRKAALGGVKGPALKAVNEEIKTLQDEVRSGKAGLQKVAIKTDPLKPISYQDNMTVAKVKTPGVPGDVADVEVRTHGPNANAPDGTWSKDNPTTQINTKDDLYRIPDPNADPNQPDPGIYKNMEDMTPEQIADAHSPAGPQPPRNGPAEPTVSEPAPMEGAFGGAAGAAAVGAGVTAGVTLYDDVGKVRSGQMSVGEAAVDVGEKSATVGGLTFAGKVAANVATTGGEAVAGAAGAEAGTAMSSVLTEGGVIGGVVAGGIAAIDDVSKVERNEMTAGTATVDVTAKTAVGVGAGMAGAWAGAEVGAAVGSVVPGLGTAVGFVAGAVVGGAVGYVGNALMNTDTGKELLADAGKAADTVIDGAKAAGSALAGAAETVASGAENLAKDAATAVEGAASTAVGAVADAGSAIASGASKAADAVETVAGEAKDALEGAAGAVADAASGLFGRVTGFVTGDDC
jgi:hypothetical protein